jgi:molybdopterin-guanine dinucleotide biosynthesis protein B
MAQVNNPPVIAFVGHSGSGKTTLLLKVIPTLTARGVHVTVIKHSSHRGIETDIPGSDTRRLWDAGAEQVALATPDRLVISRQLDIELSLEDVLETSSVVKAIEGSSGSGACGAGPGARTHHGGAGATPSIVLVEGYKRSQVPKVEVVRAACNPEPLAGLAHRVACMTDVPGLALGCPTLGLNDVAGLVELLIAPAGTI